MGNACFGKKRSSEAVVHPVVNRHQGVTMKVRMTKAQLKDLTDKVDMISNDNSELGRLIVQECSKGRFHSRVVAVAAGNESEMTNKYSRGCNLSPIEEHSDE